MAHFAKLDDNNIVIAVHVVNNDVITIDGKEVEQLGVDFLSSLHGHSNWKQTSYNGTFRKNYAGINYKYDQELDAFISEKPWPSWTLNKSTCKWESPVPYPLDGNLYIWDEETKNWAQETTI